MLTSFFLDSPHVDMDKPAGTHAWVSFAYSNKTGPYMTVYYAPRVEEAWAALASPEEVEAKKAVPDLRSTWVWHPAAKDEQIAKGGDYPFAR